ncbi:MAG TPA: response regulator transcription factor [Anaerolineaceae bacterium]
MTIRVLICDDQEIVCEGLQKILEADPEIRVCAVAYNGQEALDILANQPVDLVLMDLKMPVMNGILATRRIRQKYPETKVLVLTTYDDDEWLFDAIRSGAAGYLLKDTPRADLVAAVKGTIEGNAYTDPAVTGKLLNAVARGTPAKAHQFPPHLLGERELEILRLIVRGHSNAEIAARLFLSEGTVRNYTSAIFAKLGVADRTQAVVAALRFGIFDLSDLD